MVDGSSRHHSFLPTTTTTTTATAATHLTEVDVDDRHLPWHVSAHKVLLGPEFRVEVHERWRSFGIHGPG